MQTNVYSSTVNMDDWKAFNTEQKIACRLKFFTACFFIGFVLFAGWVDQKIGITLNIITAFLVAK